MSTNLEQRVADLERYFQMLVEMLRRHDERLDEHDNLFREADEKIAALADAQIRTEDELRRLTAQTRATDERLNKLLALFEQHAADEHAHG